MDKKFAAALSGGAVLVLALSGCGSNNDELDAWSKTVCDDVQPQAQKITAANAAIQKATSDNSAPKTVQSTDSKAFQDMSDAYKAIASSVGKAGAPPVDGGDARKQKAVKELDDTSQSYGRLKNQVDGLDTKDQGKFAVGLKSVAQRFEALVKSGNDALKSLEEGDVGKSMQKQDSCRSATARQAS